MPYFLDSPEAFLLILISFFNSLDLSYNIALCHYMMKQYAPALKHIADIIEKGIREHPGEWFEFH